MHRPIQQETIMSRAELARLVALSRQANPGELAAFFRSQCSPARDSSEPITIQVRPILRVPKRTDDERWDEWTLHTALRISGCMEMASQCWPTEQCQLQ